MESGAKGRAIGGWRVQCHRTTAAAAADEE